ncbi:MAG: PAS domain S-box protein [Syntrophaceae bacterium]|nr:PAS domain S-box protein [Syntrophaceae bacterium]
MFGQREELLKSHIKSLEERLAEMQIAESALKVSEDRYRKIFDYAPVSIREEDVTELEAAFDELRAQGVSDFRRYFDDHPDFVEKAQQLIKIAVLNDATLSLYGAKTREELIGSLGKTLVPESMAVFREELAEFAEGREIFEGENINQTLDGRKINVLVKIIYLPRPQGRREKVVVCTVDITKEKQAIISLEREMLRNQLILQTAMNGFFVADANGKIIEANLTASRITGYSTEKLLGMTLKDLDGCIVPGGSKEGRKIRQPRFYESFERTCRKKNGEIIDVEINQNYLEIDNQRFYFYFFSDISERKNSLLKLMEREKELEEQSKKLDESNVALRVLLQRVETDKRALEEDVLLNIKDLIFPYIDKLKKTGLNSLQSSYLNVILANLHDVISSFPSHLSVKYSDLTPAEIQIANLIKQGKSTKEVSEILGLSPRTIETHRRNMRKKLGIRSHGTNLRTYLSTIDNG